MSAHCFFCHGPDKGKRKAGLRLDVRESAIEEKAIVPGKPGESELIRRITNPDPKEVMPPSEAHKDLTRGQVALLRRWIAEGAGYQPHWAYIPIVRPAGNTIDTFILRALEEKGLALSAPAGKRMALRRLSLDLTGLPPSPAEVHAFAGDTGPAAWEKQIDRLLASPHFGERMAVPWLDLVRFSDTAGYHGDQNQNVFPYRDYVIDSYNRNKRFDEFTIEQLAGDLLPGPTGDQLTATGFNRLNMVTREGGAQAKEYLAKYMADRVRTVGTTWLGSTLGCAECHDHKFDPFTTRDFYAMGAFFADIKQWGVYMDRPFTPVPDLAGFTDDHPFPPEIMVRNPPREDRVRRLHLDAGQLADGAASAVEANEGARKKFQSWRSSSRRFLAAHRGGWRPLRGIAMSSTPLPAARDTGQVKQQVFTTEILGEAGPGWLAAIRVELVPTYTRTPNDGSGHERIKLTAKAIRKAGGLEIPLSFRFAEGHPKEDRYRNGTIVDGIVTGWTPSVTPPQQPHTGIWGLAEPLMLAPGDRIAMTLKHREVRDLKVSTSPLGTVGALAVGPVSLLPAKRRAAHELYLLSTGWDADRLKTLAALQAEIRGLAGGRVSTLVTVATQPSITRILPRGNWQDESGPVVEPATPEFLFKPPLPTGAPARRLTRLDLARWLVSPQNPLTARVIMNRLWRQFFGTGLSIPLNDLGGQGEPPSHPELLDWLAAEFITSGWDVKHMVKLLVMSRTYQQSSTVRKDAADADPGNRFLARQSQRRLDAEFIRDNALATAGLLNLDEIGGPSMFAYQPGGLFENLQFPSRDYPASTDNRQYRRGVYMHWQRTFLHPMLVNFDAPSREDCTADRPYSNTPQQALTLLNDPTFIEAARVFAGQAMRAPGDDAARLGWAFEMALGRPARPEEIASLDRLLGEVRKHYSANPGDARKLVAVGLYRAPAEIDPVEHAAWTSVCRVMFNLYESVTRL